jgi:protein tyrosine/serine phosphatase
MLRLLAALIFVTSAAFADRPAKWAQPITKIGNFCRITPQLYRSAQPDAEGMRELERRGVRTVINLRQFHRDEVPCCSKLTLRRVKMDASVIKDDDIALVLAMLRQKHDGPFLIHCRHGSDRTGVVCAMYRIVEQRWSREDAIRELDEGGYGFHRMFANIPAYLRKVNVEKIRRRVDELAREKCWIQGGKLGARRSPRS